MRIIAWVSFTEMLREFPHVTTDDDPDDINHKQDISSMLNFSYIPEQLSIISKIVSRVWEAEFVKNTDDEDDKQWDDSRFEGMNIQNIRTEMKLERLKHDIL